MQLRKLERRDAAGMLEWMHDGSVTRDLATDFSKKTLEDCERFIEYSRDAAGDCHMAVVSDTDEYMGTVSLKHIDRSASDAEFAITMRAAAQRKGYAWYGMGRILRLAFEELGLKRVYWCVSEKNSRAVRFYTKNGFQETRDVPAAALARYGDVPELKWFAVLSTDDCRSGAERSGAVAGCPILRVKTIAAPAAGQLSFFEAQRDVPFPIKRIYYISGVPEGVRRGFHAHKKLRQFLFCPCGRIQLILDDSRRREIVTLDDPSVGVYIDRPVWREMLWLEANSVLCVAASDYYEVSDYIRDYDEFQKYCQGGGDA